MGQRQRGSIDPGCRLAAYCVGRAGFDQRSPTWIGVGGLDLFRDEDMAYADRLRAVDVPCETIVIDGVFHGFDGIVADSAATQRFRESMFAVMRKVLARPA